MKITLAQVKKNKKIQSFVDQTEIYLDALGYTDHGERHINIVADRARSVAKKIQLSLSEQEMAAIAGYCHDMGNFLGRTQHHYWSAFLFGQIFVSSPGDDKEIAMIMQAMVTHDKNDLTIVSKVSAALILADKSDVHRSRVKERSLKNIREDIHDRVNYSVTKNSLTVDNTKKEIMLKLKLDTKVTDTIEYFEIFTERMTFCRQAAEHLGYDFVLMINDFKLS
jgi:uncharacterized protein